MRNTGEPFNLFKLIFFRYKKQQDQPGAISKVHQKSFANPMYAMSQNKGIATAGLDDGDLTKTGTIISKSRSSVRIKPANGSNALYVLP